MTEQVIQNPGVLEVFLPFDRMEKQSDGTLRVFSTINDETVDDQGEIVDYDGAKEALTKFMEFANVREMHQPIAAGIVESITHDDDLRKSTGVLHIVDSEAIKKVEMGVYKGTSLGGWKRGRTMEKMSESGPIYRVRKPIINEISLVDRPSRPTALISMMKISDMPEPPADPDPTDEPADPDTDTSGEVDGVMSKSTAAAESDPGDAAAESLEAGAGDSASGDIYIDAAGGVIPEPMAKRDIPKSHRDEMPSGDFAGPHESFPIEKPGDVAAAAHLVGKADNPASVKARIIAIAHRKGAAFVAQLPKAWRTEKSAGSDAAAGLNALGIINCLLECEFEEGEADDVAFLKQAQDAMLAFVESESKEIATGEPEPEGAMAMAYASVLGDLAKRADNAEQTPNQRALAAYFTPVQEFQAGTPAPAPIDEPLQKVSGVVTSEMAKIKDLLTERFGSVATAEALSSMESKVKQIGATLEKMATAPQPGGPLRYAMDDRRFRDLRGLYDSASDGGPGVEADTLAKMAQSTSDPIVKEALGRAAAARQINDLQQGR